MNADELMIKTIIDKGAKLTVDRLYRYRLWRIWDRTKRPALFVGLNPSTADENIDDPTIRRCIDFAMQWGNGGLLMANLFAYRATDPKELRGIADPIGRDNDTELLAAHREAGITILAWGNGGKYLGRGGIVTKMLPGAAHLRITKLGEPQHPLYLPRSTRPFAMVDE